MITYYEMDIHEESKKYLRIRIVGNPNSRISSLNGY